MRNLELERKVNNILSVYCEVDILDLEDLLEKELVDFAYEEIESALKEITTALDSEAEILQETLTSLIADQIQSMIDAKNIYEHPEDAPGQLHLFE